jgi:CHASE2 domain-containing sensor protein
MLLLILDQFEEYLRLHPEAHADAFDRLFPEVAGRTDLRVHVLISLRDDALAELDRFDGRIPHLFDNYLRLPQLTPAAARLAIERPVATVNGWRAAAGLEPVEIADGLVDEVLAQLTDPRRWSPEAASAALDADAVEPAFLQLVMKRLWEADAGKHPPILRLETLTELHGADAIVRDHLDSAMAALTTDQQDTAAAAFGYLVTPSGAKIRYTAEDLADYAHRPPADVRGVLEALADPQRRIIRRVPDPSGDPGRQGYEIFHDVLAGSVRAYAQRIRTARLERRTARLAAGLAAIVGIAAALLAYAVRFEPLQKLELRTVDIRFGLRGARPPDPKLALVAIDDRTVSRMPQILTSQGALRQLDARVLRIVAAGRPAAIVEDLEFVSGGPGTAALSSAIEATHTPVVLATSRIDNDGNTTLFGDTTPATTFFRARAAFSGLPTDPDGAVRLVGYQGVQRLAGEPGHGLPTLAVAATLAAGGKVNPAAFPNPGAWIDYAGGPGTYRPISYLDVLSGAVSPTVFRGRIVVIGRTNRAATDQLETAAAGGTRMHGPEIQANAIATVRAGLPLRSVGWPVNVASIAVLALLAAACSLRLPTTRALVVCAAAGLVLLALAQLAFDAGRVVVVVYPLLALVISAAASLLAGPAGSLERRAGGSVRRRFLRLRSASH